MNVILEYLDKLKELDIVKFFSQFFTQEHLAPWMDRLRGATEGDSAASGQGLLVWAIIIAVAIFAVDQAFYLTHPDQRELTRRRWRAIEEGVGALGESARTLLGRARAMWAGRGSHSTRR